MNTYRIVRIAGVHSNVAIDQIYKKNPDLKHRSYEEQKQAFFDEALMYSDTFSREMRKFHHFVEEILYDVEILQKTWCREKGIKLGKDKWQYEVLLAQLADLKPEIVFFQDIYSLPYDLKARLKEKIPSIQKIVLFRGYPGYNEPLFQEFALADLVLVGSPILFEKAREKNIKTHLIYHSFDPTILDKLKKLPIEKEIDFSFLGSSGFGYQAGHKDRYWMLYTLLQKTPIHLWIYEPKEIKSLPKKIKETLIAFLQEMLNLFPIKTLESFQNHPSVPLKLKRLIREKLKGSISSIGSEEPPPEKPLSSLFETRCFAPLFGLPMLQKMLYSKVVLNKHSNPAKGTVDNIRLFQTTGVGSCLLTDSGENLSDLFEEDREVVTYSSVDECIEKVNYLLEHEKVRKEIAKAGQKRTYRSHLAEHRCAEIDALIQEMMHRNRSKCEQPSALASDQLPH